MKKYLLFLLVFVAGCSSEYGKEKWQYAVVRNKEYKPAYNQLEYRSSFPSHHNIVNVYYPAKYNVHLVGDTLDFDIDSMEVYHIYRMEEPVIVVYKEKLYNKKVVGYEVVRVVKELEIEE